MKKIMFLLLALTLQFGMSKQEFEKSNGFPGNCSETSVPMLKLQTCLRPDVQCFYVNNYLYSWTIFS